MTASGVAGSTVTVDVLTNDSDPNGDSVSLDGVAAPLHGTAVIQGNQVAYTPAATYSGPDTFTYTISDGNGGTDTATVTVDVRNRAPHAAPDAATTPVAGIATVIDALANDDDPDSEAVSLASVQPTSAHGGTVTVTGDGTFRYVSADGFTGVDTFTYTVVDPRGATDTGTVTVTVTNANPVAPALSISTPGDTAVDLDLLAGGDRRRRPAAARGHRRPRPARHGLARRGGPGDVHPRAGVRRHRLLQLCRLGRPGRLR